MGEPVTSRHGTIVKPASWLVAPAHFAAQQRKARGAANPQHSIASDESGLKLEGPDRCLAVPFSLPMAEPSFANSGPKHDRAYVQTCGSRRAPHPTRAQNQPIKFFGRTHSIELIRPSLIWKIPASRNTSIDMYGVEIV